MRKEKAKKNRAQQGKIRKYSLASIFVLAATGLTYEAVDVFNDYQAEQYQKLYDTHRDVYLGLIAQGTELNATLYQNTLNYSGLSAQDIDSIQNEALLSAAARGDHRGVALALENGATPNAVNAYGYDAPTLILSKNGIESYSFVSDMALRYGVDLKAFYQNDYLQYALLYTANFKKHEDALEQLFLDLKAHGVDLAAIGNVSGGELPPSVADMVNDGGSSRLLRFMIDNAVFDAAPDALSWSYGLYKDYLDVEAAPQVRVPTSWYNRQDFRGYSALPDYESVITDNNVDPTLFVIERLDEDVERDKDATHLTHIYNTSYVAHGVMKKLDPDYGREDPNLIAARMKIGGDGAGDILPLLKYAAREYAVISESVARVPTSLDYASYYQSGYNVSVRNVRNLDAQANFVHYNAAGNQRNHACITVDGHDFCVQDNARERHSENIVRVGAVKKKGGRYTVEDYSEERPAFCAELTKRSGGLYSGTSYAAPAAAAVERRLADVFARSAALPHGVVHDDILMALMLTAENGQLKDERTGEVTPVYSNGAGLPYTNRCGAGVINAQSAAHLLADMVAWAARDAAVTPTQVKMHTLALGEDNLTTGRVGQYVYTLRAPEGGIITTLRAGLFFERYNKGAASLQIGSAPPFTLDLSAGGLSTDFRFAGVSVAADDVITLRTTKPLFLPQGKYASVRPFIDLKMAQPSSPIARAVSLYSLNQE